MDQATLARLAPVVQQVLQVCALSGSQDRWLISGMADGVDLLVTTMGAEMGYRLEAILPFARSAYVMAFPEAVRRQFEDLLARPGLAQVVEIYSGVVPPPGEARDAAFLAAGRRMLDISKCLLAIWDGAPARGPGGTGQIVAEAIARGLPVLWIDLAGHLRVHRGRAGWAVVEPAAAWEVVSVGQFPGSG
ncbi:hypothetical protein [Paragemmobacter ruber]|uniref:Uncharacterized protein n=1 Tax=Paragemmobacter ruber TaxID=1985673 RepID=A0ABW9Y7C1_9RHOB|nr:hypothetical protein [Rhodobacter ruber]NBE07762.1 hypothetical protein [Rhodobacter ruber]